MIFPSSFPSSSQPKISCSSPYFTSLYKISFYRKEYLIFLSITNTQHFFLSMLFLYNTSINIKTINNSFYKIIYIRFINHSRAHLYRFYIIITNRFIYLYTTVLRFSLFTYGYMDIIQE